MAYPWGIIKISREENNMDNENKNEEEKQSKYDAAVEKYGNMLVDKILDVEGKLEKTFASKYADKLSKITEKEEEGFKELTEKYKAKYANKSDRQLKIIEMNNSAIYDIQSFVTGVASEVSSCWSTGLTVAKFAALAIAACGLGFGIPLLVKNPGMMQAIQTDVAEDEFSRKVVDLVGGVDNFSKIGGGIFTGYGAAATLFFVGTTRKLSSKICEAIIPKYYKTRAKLHAINKITSNREFGRYTHGDTQYKTGKAKQQVKERKPQAEEGNEF